MFINKSVQPCLYVFPVIVRSVVPRLHTVCVSKRGSIRLLKLKVAIVTAELSDGQLWHTSFSDLAIFDALIV